MSFEIAKAGWLYRQSSILKRWKKNWFVLYTDGMLKYFDSPDSHVAEEAEMIPTNLIGVKAGDEVTGVTPPEDRYRGCLLMLVMRSQQWTLCAESQDDMRAWQISLEQARVIRMARHDAPPPYSSVAYPTQQPGTTYYHAGPHPPPYVVQAPAGQTTVVYADRPYYYNRGCDGGDVALGMMAGAALGTMMWGPLLWW